MKLNNKKIEHYEIDGIDSKDYPKFCDAYFCEATYGDGTALNEDELEQLKELYPDVLQLEAVKYYISKAESLMI